MLEAKRLTSGMGVSRSCNRVGTDGAHVLLSDEGARRRESVRTGVDVSKGCGYA